MSDDFADTPESLAEVRANKAANAAFWSPRDVVLSVLRDMDNGSLKPDAVVICIRQVGEAPGVVDTFFRASSPDPHIAYGLCLSAIFKMTER